MLESSFLVLGLSLLCSLEQSSTFYQKPDTFRKMPGIILRSAIEIFVGVTILLGVIWLLRQAESVNLKKYIGELSTFIAWIGAYSFRKWRRLSSGLFLMLVSYVLVIQAGHASDSIARQIQEAYVLSFYTAVVWFWITGIKRQIHLLNIPTVLNGLPIMLLAMAFLAIATNVFYH